MNVAQQNLAPLEPFLSIKEKRDSTSYISDGLKELIQDMLGRDKEVFKEIAHTSEVTSNFIQGKQLWSPNYWNNTWRPVPINRADPNRISAINIMQFYCTTQIKMLTASNPDLEPADEFKQKKYREAIKIAKAVWNRYESRFYTPWFNQQEALHMIVSGTYVESVRYDHLKHGVKAFREIFEAKEVEISPGYGMCYSCQFNGTFGDFVKDNSIPSCPECGSYEISPPEAPITQQYQSVSGIEPVECGDLDLRLCPIQTLRFDIKQRIESSSWALERIVIDKNKLQYLLGNMDYPVDETDSDYGIDSLEHISRAGNSLGGHNSETLSQSRHAIVDRISVKPEDVSHIVNREDCLTLSGEVIPKGGRLSSIVPPEGMTFLAINGGSLIIGIYPYVHHSQEMSSGVYHARLESGLGRGSEDTVEVQKRFNRNDQQITKYGEATATPAHTYIKGSVDRQHVKKIGHPLAVIPVNREVAQAMGTTDLVRTLQPGTIGAQFFQYTYDILNQYRQLTSHSTDFTNAFPGVNNTTATGARLAKSNAESIFSPSLQGKAEARRGTAKNTLKLYNKYFKGISQYFSLGETENKRHVGRHIKGEEVDPDIEFVVVRDSEQPKTMYDRQMDFVNMMGVANQGGGYAAIKQQDPKMAEALVKAFDINIDGHVYTTLVDVCEARLEQALELSRQFREYQNQLEALGMEIPELPVEMILLGLDKPIVVEEPNLEQKAKWFMDFLDSPDGFSMDLEERAIVSLLVRTHFQTAVQQMGLMQAGFTQAQVMGQGPVAEQQAMQQAQMEEAEMRKSEREEMRNKDQRAEEREAKRSRK